jgi:hypothetical protein
MGTGHAHIRVVSARSRRTLRSIRTSGSIVDVALEP